MTSLSDKDTFASDEDFPKWFEALTTHIAGQIAFLARRDPSGVTGEFNP